MEEYAAEMARTGRDDNYGFREIRHKPVKFWGAR